MSHDTIGDLAHVLRAYQVRAEISLYRERWTVELYSSAGLFVAAEHTDLETALDAAVSAAAQTYEHRRTA